MVNVRFIYFIFLVSLHCTALAEKAEKANADPTPFFFPQCQSSLVEPYKDDTFISILPMVGTKYSINVSMYIDSAAHSIYILPHCIHSFIHSFCLSFCLRWE